MPHTTVQNDEFILPGDLGTIDIGGKKRDIKQVFKKKDGSTTITIAATQPEPLLIDGQKTGLAFYSPEKTIEIIQPKQIPEKTE